MYLSPEEKAVGQENFYATIGDQLTRREFLEGAVAAGVVSGAGLGSFYFGYERSVGDPVRIGIIGTGDEGGVLIGALNPDFVEVKAIADIRPYNVHRAFHGDMTAADARPGLMKKYGWSTEDEARKHVKVYNADYHELLADPDIEGIIIALPLHLHAPVAIEAMRAGKHVLTEKLMAHSVHECKDMGRVSKQTDKVLAVGHQRHYSILYDNAVDTIRRGLIGDIHHIRAQWHRGNLPGKDSWASPLPQQLKDSLVKVEADLAKSSSGSAYEALLKRKELLQLQILDEAVEASKYGYEEKTLEDGRNRPALEELIRWRLWNRTGGGLMAELGSHQLDASSIFVSSMQPDGKKVHPLSVSGVGGRHIFPPDRDSEDHVYAIYEFPGPGYAEDPNKKICVTYSSINGNGFGGYGEIVLGTKGTLILEREMEVMLFKDSSTTTSVAVVQKEGAKSPALDTYETGGGARPGAAVGRAALGGPVSRGYTEEIEHWAWCLRNRSPENLPRCYPKVAMADAIIALVTNQSIREARRIEFKPEWFDIDSDETPEGEKPSIPVA